MALSITFSEILPHIGRKSLLPPPLYMAPSLGVTPSDLRNDLWWRKTRVMGLSGRKNFDDTFSRFDTKHACDRRTDRLNWRCIYRALSIASRGKNPGKYEQESSAKLTNQRVSYVFTSSPLSFHARHILSTSKFQDSYSCILLIFLDNSDSERHVWELLVWIQFTALTLPLQVTPMNNSITLLSLVQSLGYILCCRW